MKVLGGWISSNWIGFLSRIDHSCWYNEPTSLHHDHYSWALVQTLWGIELSNQNRQKEPGMLIKKSELLLTGDYHTSKFIEIGGRVCCLFLEDSVLVASNSTSVVSWVSLIPAIFLILGIQILKKQLSIMPIYLTVVQKIFLKLHVWSMHGR